MSMKRDPAFYKLLHEIEYKIGDRCYNGNIQNYGPDGYFLGEGRWFRYPVTYRDFEKERYDKYYGMLPDQYQVARCEGKVFEEKECNSAHYNFGANDLYIFSGIKNALEMLEERFNINFDQLLKDEETQKNQP